MTREHEKIISNNLAILMIVSLMAYLSLTVEPRTFADLFAALIGSGIGLTLRVWVDAKEQRGD